MKLYHASNVAVPKPDVEHSRLALDFGKGFYLTSILEQAVNYGRRFTRRKQVAWLNVYELDFAPEEWNIRIFESYDRNWLDFISSCRAGEDISEYEMVIGGIANDKVIQTLDRFFAGEIDAEQTLGSLKYENPNIQYCIRSQAMLDKCLTFIKSQKL